MLAKTIKFYSYLEFVEAIPVPIATYTTFFNLELSDKEVATKYSNLEYMPQSVQFELNIDNFLESLNEHQYFRNTISSYYIEIEDFNNAVIFRGWIKRGDIDYNDLEGLCSIVANDMLMIVAEAQDNVIMASRLTEQTDPLTNIDNFYRYYLTQILEYYFYDLSGFSASDFFAIEYEPALYFVDTLQYESKDVRMQDIANVFMNVNQHTIIYDIAQNKLIIQNIEYRNRTLTFEEIPTRKVFNFKRQNLFLKAEFDDKIANILNQDEEYKTTIEQILISNYNNFDRVNRIIKERISCSIENIYNDYDLFINQYIKIDNNNYIIKSINKDTADYKIECFNAGNPLTSNLFMLGYKGWNTLKSFQSGYSTISSKRNLQTITYSTASNKSIKKTNKSLSGTKTNY